MNFTHLLPTSDEPSQELLQRFDHFMVVSVLDDAMAQFVEKVAGMKIRWAEKTLCQIVKPLDFDLALPGTALDEIGRCLRRDPRAPSNHDHSFVACASRSEVLSHPPKGGLYIPLLLNTLKSDSEREESVSAAVSEAIGRSGRLKVDEEMRKKLQSAAAAASVVASLFRIKLGLP